MSVFLVILQNFINSKRYKLCIVNFKKGLIPF